MGLAERFRRHGRYLLDLVLLDYLLSSGLTIRKVSNALPPPHQSARRPDRRVEIGRACAGPAVSAECYLPCLPVSETTLTSAARSFLKSSTSSTLNPR